ncbi:helix-turn-helix transcriptional regulator [Kribbella sp. NPDC051718]|uniref:helix-turn-helix domain-containing protein n=1 Tax=Kribbella sp. NPDC051718 TaxID=3155168 RepID=UPI00342646F3
MEEQARAIGERVRYWRQRRGIDRKRFGDMVGRSTSWLDKVEKGERNLLRLPMLERVADALSITPEVLTDGPAARRASDCVDAVEVQEIRSALGRYPSLSLTSATTKPPTVAKVTQQLDYLGQAWISSNFTAIAQHLPKLINDAQVLTAIVTSEDESRTARRSLVMTYRLASSMLLKFEANQIAWLAADRAMQVALPSSDTVALARATRSVARAMTSAGQESDAIVALTNMADRMRPNLSRQDDDQIPLFGMLFLAASIAAAGIEDHSTALLMHEEAEGVVSRLSMEHRSHYTVFGPANVAAHRFAVLNRLHESGRALEYVAGLDPAIIATLPPERRSNYLLDLTTAYTYTGTYQKAVAALTEAERLAPQEVRCRPLAHGLLRALLTNTTGSLSRSVQQMATRSGVEA